MNVPLYILAGGRSSRFGSDKARHVLGGVALLRRVAEGFGPRVSAAYAVAATAGAYDDLGVATIADDTPHQGPLGGLVRALRHRLERGGTGWLLLCGCDFVDPGPRWLDPLLATAERALDAGAVASHGERWEPMPGLYHTRLLPVAERHLEAGRGAMWRLLEAAGAVRVGLPSGAEGVPQANTREAMEQYQARI